MQKRLYRSNNEKMISGVCGGVAEYFDVDPTIVRVLWVFLTLTGLGFGLILYIIMAFMVPENPIIKTKTK
ncbi:PspC domain-containing protein [archaeon]|nr:PspC domain-containing protein [archaeon]